MFLLLHVACAGLGKLSVFFLCMALVGFGYALFNGVPMQVGPIDNDGHNAMSLGKNPKAMRGFWIQLKVAEQNSKRVRLKDKNMEAAEKYKEAFDKMAKTYPYAYDIESEREIMAVAELRNS